MLICTITLSILFLIISELKRVQTIDCFLLPFFICKHKQSHQTNQNVFKHRIIVKHDGDHADVAEGANCAACEDGMEGRVRVRFESSKSRKVDCMTKCCNIFSGS